MLATNGPSKPAFRRHVCKPGMAAVGWLGGIRVAGPSDRGSAWVVVGVVEVVVVVVVVSAVRLCVCACAGRRERVEILYHVLLCTHTHQAPPPSRDASDNTTATRRARLCEHPSVDRPPAPIGSYRFLHTLHCAASSLSRGRAMLAAIDAGLGRYLHLLGHPTSPVRPPACSRPLRYPQPSPLPYGVTAKPSPAPYTR